MLLTIWFRRLSSTCGVISLFVLVMKGYTGIEPRFFPLLLRRFQVPASAQSGTTRSLAFALAALFSLSSMPA